MFERPESTHEMHTITEVRIRLVPGGNSGLVAFASCRYGGVLLNDIAVPAVRPDQVRGVRRLDARSHHLEE